MTNFEKNTAMYIFDTNNNKLYEVDEKLSSAQNKLLYMGYWIGAESRKIKVICSPASIGRGYEIIEENDYKRLKKAREKNAKYMDNNVRVIKREEEERKARIAAQDRSMQLKREAEKKEKEEAIHAAQRRELEVRKMEEEEKRRNEEEKNNRLEREMLVEQERRKKEEEQSCKEREETSQEDDDCIIMNDSFNCCSNSGESSSNQKCIIPLRRSDDIPDVKNYGNYEVAKDCIIQYELPEWLCVQLKSLSDEYENIQNTNVQLSCEEDGQFWSVFYQVRYFPRTLCETFFVFNEEFSFSQPQLPDNKINILSIGCGSGGDIIGLLLAIDSYLTKEVKVSIVVFEVNNNAYNCFENNLNSVTKLFQHVEVEKPNRRNSAISFDNNDFEGLKDKFHFILCSKMVNEIMRIKFKDAVKKWDGKNIEDLKLNIKTIEQEFQGLYKKLLEKLSPRMSEKGYCLLSELTDKPIPKELSSPGSFDFYLDKNPNLADYEALSKLNNRNDLLSDLNNIVKFLPQYLNSGVKSFIRDCPTFRPVSPWGCDGCWTRADCFTQLQFYVHNPVLSNANDRFEGVCFRLIKKESRVNGNRNNNLAVNIRRGESRFIVKSCGSREELTGDNIQSAFERQRN